MSNFNNQTYEKIRAALRGQCVDSKAYRIFISHSWRYSDSYEKLTSLLDKRAGFYYDNFSVPEDTPIRNVFCANDLYQAIKDKMRNCEVVLFLVGLYATHSEWMNLEMQAAKELDISTLAVEEWGSKRTSQLKYYADKVVAWNADSIVKSIEALVQEKRLALGRSFPAFLPYVEYF